MTGGLLPVRILPGRILLDGRLNWLEADWRKVELVGNELVER